MRRIAGSLTGTGRFGVVWGFEGPKPASGLTQTYIGGIIRLALPAGTQNPLGYGEFQIASATKLYTASKDTYAYVTTAGVLSYVEVANNAAKPSQATVGVGSQFIWKVVTNGTDITSVVDLRQTADADLVIEHALLSFVAANVGSFYIQPGFRGRLIAIDSEVSTALAGTDTGTETAALVNHDNTVTAVTNGVVTHSISAAIGERKLALPTAVHEFGPGDRLRITTAKATSGGWAVAKVIMERLG